MGNWRSKPKKDKDDIIATLTSRLEALENADVNHDGVVTRNELDNWKKFQHDQIEQFRQTLEHKYSQDLIRAENEIIELNRQIEALKSINDGLNNRLATNIPREERAQTERIRLIELSQNRVNQVVDEMLADSSINLKYLPDWAEKKLYYNVLTMMINIMDHTLDSTDIRMFGHKITFDLKPIE